MLSWISCPEPAAGGYGFLIMIRVPVLSYPTIKYPAFLRDFIALTYCNPPHFVL